MLQAGNSGKEVVEAVTKFVDSKITRTHDSLGESSSSPDQSSALTSLVRALSRRDSSMVDSFAITDVSIVSSSSATCLEGSNSNAAYVCCYEHGRLLRESRISLSEINKVMVPLRQNSYFRRRKTLKARITGGSQMGKIITENNSSFNLMTCLQLGIRFSVGRVAAGPILREPSNLNYELKVSLSSFKGNHSYI